MARIAKRQEQFIHALENGGAKLGHASAEMTRRYQRRRDRFRVNLTLAAGL